jgi:hypothetical protein
MASDCFGSACDTSVFGLLPVGFGIQVTTDDLAGSPDQHHGITSVAECRHFRPRADLRQTSRGPPSGFTGLSDLAGRKYQAFGGDEGDRVAASDQANPADAGRRVSRVSMR